MDNINKELLGLTNYGFQLRNISLDDLSSYEYSESLYTAHGSDPRNKNKNIFTIGEMNIEEKKVLMSNRNKLLRASNKYLIQNGYSKAGPTELSKISWKKTTSPSIKHIIGIRNLYNYIEINLFFTVIIDVDVLIKICDTEYQNELRELATPILDGLKEWSSGRFHNFRFMRIIPCDNSISIEEVKKSVLNYFDNIAFPIANKLSTIEDLYCCYISNNMNQFMRVWTYSTAYSNLNLAYFYIKYGDYLKAMELIEESYQKTIDRIDETNDMYDRLSKSIENERERNEEIEHVNNVRRFYEILLVNLFSLATKTPLQ